MKSLSSFMFASASLFALTVPFATQAQAAPAPAKAAKEDAADIVVTGTSLRKVAPAGAESFSVSAAQIKASGATSTQALLANIPQMSGFGTTPYAGIGGTRQTVNKVNLRSLPQGTGGGSPTLTLMDGHRFVGSGIQQSQPDPGIIPPGMIDRVEVALDGGSAVYGADAVGGVLNFITKRDFNGMQVSATHGFGDKYSTNNIDFLAGKKWSTGSVYVGYSYAYNSSIKNADRDFERQGSYASGAFAPAGVQCNAGNVKTNGSTYAVTSPTTLALSNANLCDTTKYGDQFPKEVRHSVMAGFHQELGSSVDFDVKGYYSVRTNTLNPGILGYTVNKKTTDASGYVSTGDANSTKTQAVSGNFLNTTGPFNPTLTRLTSWGITPKLTWKIGHDWQMVAFYNAGESQTTVHEAAVNATPLQAAATAGTFNPYNPGAAGNAGAIAQALNYENYGIGIQHMDNARIVFDGPAFHLPGGDVRVAVGGEYLRESYRGVNNTSDTLQASINPALHPLSGYKRNEKSGFAEINVPVIGAANRLPFIYSLSFSAAERYDSYSDFGNNWSPSLGASLKPVEWINLRAHWTKAFQAPSTADLGFAVSSATYRAPFIYGFAADLVNPLPNTQLGTFVGGGAVGATTANGFINIGGTSPTLKPQRSTDLSLGIDISPPFVPGLALHGSYFKISYQGTISAPPHGFSGGTYYTNFPSLYAMNPTYAQVVSALTAAGISSAAQANVLTQASCAPGPGNCNLYFVSSDLTQNLGNTKVSGLDLGFEYKHNTGFGSVYANFNGTYLLNYQTSPSSTAAYSVNGVGNDKGGFGGVARFNFTTALGASVGENFRGQIKWNHIDGYSLTVPAGLGQTSVGAYNFFDVFMSYDLKQGDVPPINFSLGVTNVFNKNPPNYNGQLGLSNGYSGSTFGRVVTLGASIKF